MGCVVNHIQIWSCFRSPHIKSIRERITAGKSGEPITAEALQKLLKDVQATLDESVAAESGSLTHFEVSPGDYNPCSVILTSSVFIASDS